MDCGVEECPRCGKVARLQIIASKENADVYWYKCLTCRKVFSHAVNTI